MPNHTVQQGECLASIAKEYGFSDWRTIYDHPENAEFRRKRPDPNVIHPNDRLFIPEKEQKEESGQTEQRHRFRRSRPVTALRLILQDEQRDPWGDRRYKLVVEGQEFTGETDNEGLIDQDIPADAESGHLTVWLPPRQDNRDREILRMDYVDQDEPGDGGGAAGGQPSRGSSTPTGQSRATEDSEEEGATEDEPFEWELAIGHLDPVEQVSGVQARLYNLGFSPGPIDNINGPLTREAVRRFQEANGLTVDGIAGPNTQDKLKQLHGC